MTVNYLLDGKNIYTEYGIRVQKSTGVLDIPALKDPIKADWKDQHGIDVDLSAVQLKENKIKLKCYCKASSPADLITKLTAFKTALTTSGLRQLIIEIGSSSTLAFMVYLSEDIEFEKEWRENTMYVAFTLEFIEPEPIKIFGKIIASPDDSSFLYSVNVTGIADYVAIVFHWGDGNTDRIVMDNVSIDNITHLYTVAGTYYVVIVGEVTGLGAEVIGKTSFEIYPTDTW